MTNWEYMANSNGRRFKEAILIDPNSIKFVDIEFLDNRLANLEFTLHDELRNKFADGIVTNLMLLREYLYQLLLNNPQINTEYITMVRITTPTMQGIPLELTAFTFVTDLIDHEAIKSQILEISFAVVKMFELRVSLKTS